MNKFFAVFKTISDDDDDERIEFFFIKFERKKKEKRSQFTILTKLNKSCFFYQIFFIFISKYDNGRRNENGK
jgi:hypothetical protein